MVKGQRTYRAHCLILPYPIQGHINPMLQFAKLLDHRVEVTLVTTRYIYKTMQGLGLSCLSWETISDGFNEGGMREAGTVDAYVESFWIVGSRTFSELLEKLLSSASPADCVIYVSFIPWSLDVAKKFGIAGAVFFTQYCAVGSIYYHVHEGLLKLPLADDQSQISLPGLPPLDPLDFPSFVYDSGSYRLSMNWLWDSCPMLTKLIGSYATQFMSWKNKSLSLSKLWRLRTVGVSKLLHNVRMPSRLWMFGK